ncbi:MAG: DNA translocase FtsK [Bacilli bacterium]|nr:DNA translocase FtsK [Bacilli bacterium]
MIDVKKVISLIKSIQESGKEILDLRDSLAASYDKETKKINADSKSAIDGMKQALDDFEISKFVKIKDKVLKSIEALRQDYSKEWEKAEVDASIQGIKGIKDNEEKLNELITTFNSFVKELNAVDFDALVPPVKIKMVDNENFYTYYIDSNNQECRCEDTGAIGKDLKPLTTLVKKIFSVCKGIEMCVDAIIAEFEKEFNLKDYESYVKASAATWLSEKKGRDDTEFAKKVEEHFTGEKIQASHKKFFDELEEGGRISEVDLEAGTLEYKQSITIGSMNLLVTENNDLLDYIKESPVLSRYMGDGYLAAPVILDLKKQGNILLNISEKNDEYSEENANFINQIILQFLLSFPVGRLHLWLIDVEDKMKFKFSMLNTVENNILHGNTIIKNIKGAETAISELKGMMDEITDNKLNQNGVADIFEFNEKFEALKQDIHLLVLVDYPNGITKQTAKELKQVMSNGNSTGIFTLLVNNTTVECEDYSYKETDRQDFIFWAKNNALTLTETKKKLRLSMNLENYFTPKAKINMDIFREVIEILKRNKELTKTKPVPMSQMFEASDKDLNSAENAPKVLDIPIGVRGADIQTLKLDASGNGSPHAVVIGGTGSGKSILLHTIILSACYKYSPEDLNFYLIDFKGGREFEYYQANKVVEKQLPHIKLTGLTNDVEDGLAILQNLQIELQRRNDLFAEKGVKDIIQYRKAGGKMPRLFVLVDEIQELFEKDEKLGQKAITILRELFKLGRAYGISLLWASQNIPRVVGLKDQVLSQIGNRISLKLNNPDEAMDIGIDSKKVRALNRPEKGLGVINDIRNGDQAEEFRVAFAEDDLQERNKLAEKILNKWKDVERDDKPLYIVGDSTEPSPIEDGTLFARRIQRNEFSSKSYDSYKLQFGNNYITGEPFNVTIPVLNDNKSNLLFVGTDIDFLRDLMGYSLFSTTIEHISNTDFAGNTDKIYYANGEMFNPKDSKDLYNVLRDDFTRVIEDVSPTSKFKDAIQTIYKEYKSRAKEADTVGLKGKYAPYYFVVHSIQRYADLFNNNPKLVLKETTAPVKNDFSVGMNTDFNSFFAGPSSAPTSSSADEKDFVFFVDAVKELLERGGQYGIHFIISIDTPDSLKVVNKELCMSKFKIFTKGVSSSTISQIVGGAYNSSYNITNSKIALMVYQDSVAKICAYRYDDEKDATWYKQIKDHYLSL